MVNFKAIRRKSTRKTRVWQERCLILGSITSLMKVFVALLGEYALVVSKSRFLMGNIIKLTNDVSGTDLENYED